MSMLETRTFSFNTIEPLLDALLMSENPVAFCRALVHNGLPSNGIQGCQLFYLNDGSNLVLVAGYGKEIEFIPDEISVWEENALSVSIRTREFSFDATDSEKGSITSIPLLKDRIPVGCLVLVFSSNVEKNPIDEKLIPIISKLGAHSLNLVPMVHGKAAPMEPNGESLTTRQIEILRLMDKGMVNSEIAAQLIVSESTIRQESVRIYRSLGVPNRTEAAKKGLALGIIRRPNLYTVE